LWTQPESSLTYVKTLKPVFYFALSDVPLKL
jgi:hypothetical protein